jgi:hypothetical protein
MSKKLAVYHQCFNNKKATEFAIKNFKQYNPDIDYYLVSDGGEDFSEIAKKYFCNYIFEKNNIGMNYYTVDQAHQIMNRLKTCAINSSSEYLLLMEDDVLCRKKFNLHTTIDLAGVYSPGNVIPNEVLDYLSKKYNVFPNINWYNACGGTILNTEILLNKFDLIEKFINEDHDYIVKNLSGEKYNFGYGSMDQLLVLIYFVCGKKVTVNEHLTEYWRNPNWMNSDHALVHQYKEQYV